MSKEVKLTEQEYLLAEVVMKVAALERLLIKAGVFSAEALNNEMKSVSEDVMAFVQKKISDEAAAAEKEKGAN